MYTPIIRCIKLEFIEIKNNRYIADNNVIIIS